MAPYHHFADKRALIAAVAAEGFRMLRQEMLERIEACGGDARTRFRESGIAYVVFAVKHPNLFRVMFGEETADTSEHPELKAAASQAFAVLQGLVEQDQVAVGTRDDRDREKVGLSAWALVHGIAMLCIDGQFGPEARRPEYAEKFAYEATGALARGLRGG
jgi:AcrR family transcriptional regulator